MALAIFILALGAFVLAQHQPWFAVAGAVLLGVVFFSVDTQSWRCPGCGGPEGERDGGGPFCDACGMPFE